MKILTTIVGCLMALCLQAQPPLPKFDVQGHRGARGLKPENSIPAFITALDSGVTTLELDLVITKDKQVVVSHEPWMSAQICMDSSGKAIEKKDELKFNIYRMTYEEVRAFDCGSKGNEHFPDQEKMRVNKPLLSDVINAVEDHIKSFTNYEVDYNMEIKSDPEGDNVFHPAQAEFSDLVYQLIDQYLPLERVMIQSFDFRILQYWHEKYPKVRLSALVENRKSVDENLADLGFTPSAYCPYYKLLSAESVKYLHTKTFVNGDKKSKKIRVIPWTVNEEKDMIKMKEMGVDGLITDYPDKAAKFREIPAVKSNGKK